MRFIKVLLTSFWWAKSLRSASSGEYQLALFQFEKSARYTVRLDAEMLVFQSFLYLVLKKDKDCIECLNKAIDSISSSTSLNSDEKKYLTNYVTYLLSAIQDFEEPFGYDDEFEYKNINKRLIKNFPYKKGIR